MRTFIGGLQTNRKEETVKDISNIQPCQCDEDDIDLRELLKVIKKRKSIIIVTVISFLVLAVIYLLVSKPVYEAVATLKIGGQLIGTNNSIEKKYFEDAGKLKEYLYVKYDVSGKYRKRGVRSYIEDVSVPRNTKGFITIIACGPNNEEAIKTLKVALYDVIKKNEAYYNKVLNKYRLRLIYLNKNYNFLSKEITTQTKILSDLSNKKNKIKKSNPDLAALIILQISQMKKNLITEKNDLLETKKNINLTKLYMQPTYLVMTKIVGKIYTHNYPAKPKKKLILVAALITGLILGIFLVFFLEFIGKEEY